MTNVDNKVMSRAALNRALLARQMLLSRHAAGVVAAVEALAGMQAQEPRPPFIGLWSRLLGFGREELLAALRDRHLVRATLLRGTQHLVSARDYTAWRGLVQPMLTAAFFGLGERTRHMDPLPITAVARPFMSLPHTFTDLRAHLAKAFPDEADDRAMGHAVRCHLPLVTAPDDSPWGVANDPEYVAAEEWLEAPVDLQGDLQDLARRYLAAFGPATAADMQAWCGLKGLKPVLDSMAPELVVLRDEGGKALWDLPDAPRPPPETPAPVRYIPAFDNLVLAHADRTRIVDEAWRPRIVAKNLHVAATFLVDGMVAGIWKTTRKAKLATLALEPFIPLAKADEAALREEGEALLRFLEPDAPTVAVIFAAS
ncbi:winged helix DNA-binding domain-containing protein [Azospirillum sp. B4]|uniref:winged helix DNA-binding domain-containing protein n=1 Tax=Azospirillum sp. B4 TaxID=95605 RepID=UPI0003497575|nr:winged helix DNA-binding domain-containing protein [Azospirillum sp. B4]